MNSIRIYDEAVMSYLKQITITDGEETRIPQVAFAIPSRLDNKLILSDNGMPLLPMLVVIRESLEPTDFSGIVRTHIPRPSIYVYDDTKEKVYGIDAMPYYFNYIIESWHLTQNSYLEMLNKLIWKFEKYKTIPAKFTLNNLNLGINGYIENYSISDDTDYAEVSESNIRLIRGTCSIKVFGWIFEEDYVKRTVIENIQNIIVSDSGKLKVKDGLVTTDTEEEIDLNIANLNYKKIKLDSIKNILMQLISSNQPPIYTEPNGKTWTVSKLRDEYLKINKNINLESHKRKHKTTIKTIFDKEGNIIGRTESLL